MEYCTKMQDAEKQYSEKLVELQGLIDELKNNQAVPNGEVITPGIVTEVKSLRDDMNVMVNSRNMKFLLVDGVPERENENTPEWLVEFLKDKLKPGFKFSDVENANRVGPKKPGVPRTIKVEFVFAHMRRRVYLSRIQLNKLPVKVFISEFLTRQSATIFYMARQEVKKQEQRKISKCWTLDGLVYVAKKREDRGTVIRSVADLNTFFERGVNPGGQPMVAYMNSLY